MLWAIDKRCRHFHRFVSGSGLDSASARNALSSVAASGDSEGHGLPAIWGHAPSSSGIFSDLFGIARPIGQVICGALRTEQAADIGGMVGAGIEVGEIVDPGRKVHGAVGGRWRERSTVARRSSLVRRVLKARPGRPAERQERVQHWNRTQATATLAAPPSNRPATSIAGISSMWSQMAVPAR